MKKHLKIISYYIRLNLASALEYRASFITQAFCMALSNSSFILFWGITFSQIGGTIANYNFKDIVFIWAITSTGFGISNILFTNASNITNLIVTGELDAFLLQPCNVIVNVLCAKTSLSAYGDFIYGIVLICLFYGSDFRVWIWFIFGSLICGCLLTAVTLTAHTLSFYLGDASSIGQFVAEFMMNFSIYPEKIYGPFIRVIMYSIIPAGIAVHLPLVMLHSFSFMKLLLALVTIILYCVFAGKFFYCGLKRYESGNVIATRL